MPDFFTAVSYKNSSNSFQSLLIDKVDDYFFLGGKKAYVIQGRTKKGQEKAVLSEAKTSLLERVAKVFSYFTVVVPFFMLIIKAGLRSRHSYKIIDPKQKLEKGLNVSEETAAKIQALLPAILNRKEDEEIEWLSQGNNLVFKLKQQPNLVFKMARPNRFGYKTLPAGGNENTHSRFENMVKAKEVCLANQLGLLIIPHAKKLMLNADGNEYPLIVEESLDIVSHHSAQEELYREHSADLNESIRELAAFVAKTGFNDVIWRNIPLMKDAHESKSTKRIALIDLEHMNSAENGFIGDWNGSVGLIGCVSETQIDMVIEEARKQGVSISDSNAQEAKDRRLKRLAEDEKLRTFYEKSGIVNGKEALQVDLDTLGLDLTEKKEIRQHVGHDDQGNSKFVKQTLTFRKVAADVIAEINKQIQNNSDQASTKSKRYILLNTNEHPLNSYSFLGIPSGNYFIGDADENQLWLRRIITALVDKGYLFKLDKVNGHGYFIQA